MFDTSMTCKYNGVAHDDDFDGGRRYATDWTVGKDRYRVSSVDNAKTTETMLFRIEEDGEVNYFDLRAEREFLSNASQHAKFLSEFLENLGS